MPKIHRITHDDQLVERKVNFFADYFAFAAETIGTNDIVPIENPLSLVDKIIFQVTHNPNRCIPYVDGYLNYFSFLEWENYKEFKSYKRLKNLIIEYKANKKQGLKITWLQSNPEFLQTLNIFKRDLKKIMFKKALREIISYLRCVHEIETHKEDLINQTNIIVSELVLNDRSKNDIAMIFERIITREIGKFPFSKSLKSPEEKENFIKNRNFQQQFDGIYNILKEKLSANYFIFRVYGLKSFDQFTFVYNRVTFYNPKHEKLQEINKKIKGEKFLNDFLENDEYLLLAVVRAEYGSIDIATSNAVEIINRELQFINKVFSANCYLEKFSYLLTPDFVSIGWQMNAKDKGHRIITKETELLKDNPYNFLKKSPKRLKEDLLKYEPIFVDALMNRNISTYWQYLETIIPATKHDEKQVIHSVSNLLLLNAETHYKNRLRSYIIGALSPLSISAAHLGISTSRQLEIINRPDLINWRDLKDEINHPFLKYLVGEFLSKLHKQDLLNRKHFYEVILLEAYAQRNSIIHRGFANEKSLITLNGTLPRFVNRLRWILFDGIKQKVGNDYPEIVFNLKEKASMMIQK